MAKSIHDFFLNSLGGKPMPLSGFAGRAVLLVKTASKCGLTPQYAGLQALYDEYNDRGLTVLGLPCNQFGAQEPGDAAEIGSFCATNYAVSFPLTEKIEVNGDGTHPLYQYLKDNAPPEIGEVSERMVEHLKKNYPENLLGTNIKWNFTKFLVDKQCKVVARFGSGVPPEELKPQIEALL